ncbi:unnamed protein product [Arabis nemorensis]|uniref:Uncharacterized protein n=1 Tax=Arabis nemorensis TaxID=586526 RepID=A0A565BC27_9BRAS|nr:unnamed protein product [Arabis nemorensis]
MSSYTESESEEIRSGQRDADAFLPNSPEEPSWANDVSEPYSPINQQDEYGFQQNYNPRQSVPARTIALVQNPMVDLVQELLNRLDHPP